MSARNHLPNRKFNDKELSAFKDLARSEQGRIVREGLERHLREVDQDLRTASADKIPRLQAEASFLEDMIERLDITYHQNVNAR